MPRSGGARPGAGRPKGSKDKKNATQKKIALAAATVLKAKGYEIAARVAHEKMTPLEVLCESMHKLRDAAIECEELKIGVADADDEAKDEKGLQKIYTAVQLRLLACDQAAKAAPYVHARLQAIEANVSGKISLYETGLLELAGDEGASVP